jgi:TRAP-type C4-dicarboxylate transport system permease small subunit
MSTLMSLLDPLSLLLAVIGLLGINVIKAYQKYAITRMVLTKASKSEDLARILVALAVLLGVSHRPPPGPPPGHNEVQDEEPGGIPGGSV